jgi:hypothetical protein
MVVVTFRLATPFPQVIRPIVDLLTQRLHWRISCEDDTHQSLTMAIHRFLSLSTYISLGPLASECMHKRERAITLMHHISLISSPSLYSHEGI